MLLHFDISCNHDNVEKGLKTLSSFYIFSLSSKFNLLFISFKENIISTDIKNVILY